ncbi:phage head-tail connector protein [Clostridium botulinum]|uniref:phage head-tail connector protein n=1 Tax=Clostridium botulinum TaxID=1491 RepID=UPI0022467AD4|nr:phage head-tail connector protein [Clostridium botulinum]UZP02296.1 phage head-tail connector protein [Clostridium botulinum]UZP05655.1 phage head-tail connector protein [Clostridium botulinum]UZP09035.1 phage head-tail connector protein [Clostridium botulinum]
MVEKIIEAIKLRPGISNIDEFLLADIVQDAVIEVSDYINIKEGEELPLGCISIVKDISIIKANKLGSEGISSESYSGVSQSYTEDIPKDILRKLKRYRKLPR